MITTDECRELALLLGIEWHEKTGEVDRFGIVFHVCSCGQNCQMFSDLTSHCNSSNPNFHDPRVVLREAVKMEKWPEFCSLIGFRGTSGGNFDGISYNPEWWELIDVKYILDKRGKLARALLDFMRKEQSK